MNVFVWLGVAAALAGPGSLMEREMEPPEIAPARDGNIAIKEELCAARKKGTIEAFDLFIARHPDHPLTDIARRERQRLRQAR